MKCGTLYGIGIGPGDPELITLRGMKLVQSLRRVYLPATAPGRSYAGEIAASYLDPARQEVVQLVCPPLRNREALQRRWAELASEVAAALADGEDAAFLTEGDPSLYSTFQYLAAALRRDHPQLPIQIVPGVTSVCAAAAVAGRPLAMWDEAFAIVPATASPEVLAAALQAADGLAVLKPGSGADGLMRMLIERETELDVALVRRAGRPEQSIAVSQAAFVEAPLDYFSLLLVRRRPA